MISLAELNPKKAVLTAVQEANLKTLLSRINQIRAAWARPMIVTSGFRTEADHRRVYTQIAKRKGVTFVRIPMGSKHLSGQAVDISDPDGALMAWCKTNFPLLEVAGLWCEAGTVGWVHFQSIPPASGKRFFKP